MAYPGSNNAGREVPPVHGLERSNMDPIKQLYQKMTDKAIDEVRHHRKPPLRFRPSEAGDCVRKIWFRLRGQRPAPRTATSDMYGIRGDVDHDVVRQLMNHYDLPIHGVDYDEDGVATETMASRLEFDVPTKDGMVRVEVSGRADGWIDVDGYRMLCEIKGTGFYPYDWLRKTYESEGHAGAVDRIKKKHREWYYQCQATMALTGFNKCYLIVVDRASGTIGLWNKETGDREGIILDFDSVVWLDILQKFAYIKWALSTNTMPPAEFAAGSKECSYCPFFYVCHGAAARRAKGLSPAVVYPGPQLEIYNDEDDGTNGVDSGAVGKDALGEVDDS